MPDSMGLQPLPSADCLHASPGIINRLLTAVHDENMTLGVLAEIIEADDGLSLRLLRMANSPFYGMQHEVQTVEHAVAVLGIRKLKSLVVSIANCFGASPGAVSSKSNLMQLVESRLKENPEVRPFPACVNRLLSALRSEDSTSKTFANIIECDPGLALRLLRLANSPIFGLRKEVQSVEQAVTILGTRKLKSIVLSLVGSAMFRSGDSAATERLLLLDHSIGCATVARVLANYVPGVSTDDAFLAGMFHDIGKLFFFDVAPNEYAKISLTATGDLIDRERGLFGLTHEEVGIKSGSGWPLAEEIVAAIGYHHQPNASPAHLTFVSAIHVANQLAKLGGIGSNAQAEMEPPDDLMASLGVERSSLEEVLEKAAVDFAETREACV